MVALPSTNGGRILLAGLVLVFIYLAFWAWASTSVHNGQGTVFDNKGSLFSTKTHP